MDYHKGANAILELSRLVLQLHSMTDPERGITVSVGTIRGGTASNVIPEEAEAEVDLRVEDVGGCAGDDGAFSLLARRIPAAA